MELRPIVTLYSNHREKLAPMLAELLDGEWGALSDDLGIWLKIEGMTLHIVEADGSFRFNEKQLVMDFVMSDLSELALLRQKIEFLKYRYHIELNIHEDHQNRLILIDSDGRHWRFTAEST